jgi:hypothetical protein
VINHVADLVIGVDKIVGIYNDEKSNKLLGISLSLINGRLIEQDINMQGGFEQVRQMQNEKLQYKWLNKTQIPYEINAQSNGQLNIFNEYNYLILMVSIPQQGQEKRNLVFIYFKDELDQFGIHHDKANMSTQNKTIIGHLVSNSVISLSSIYWQQEERFIQFATKSQEIFKHRDTNKHRQTELENLIIGWAQDILEECSESDGVNYVYSKKALDKIKSFTGEFSQLRKNIEEAIDYTKVLNTYVNSEYVNIEDVYITDVNNETKQDPTQVLPERLQKTQSLLDKLEKYAIQVSNQGLNITSSNVGQAMQRPISPAAISDSISKHRSRINTLFMQYPGKWTFIKTHFKPIINITSNDNIQLKNWG